MKPSHSHILHGAAGRAALAMGLFMLPAAGLLAGAAGAEPVQAPTAEFVQDERADSLSWMLFVHRADLPPAGQVNAGGVAR